MLLIIYGQKCKDIYRSKYQTPIAGKRWSDKMLMHKNVGKVYLLK